jgi:uncharacterized lipoprotein YmbA
MNRIGRCTAGLLLALVPVVAGCRSPEPKLYTLSPLPGAQLSLAPAQVAVGRIVLPAYLDRQQMIHYTGANQIASEEFDQWAEPFGNMLTRVLVADLALRLPASKVFGETGFIIIPDAVIVDLDVSEFAVGASGKAELNARWMIRRPRGKSLVGSARCFVAAPASNMPADYAGAMSSALASLSDSIAAALAGAPLHGGDCPPLGGSANAGLIPPASNTVSAGSMNRRSVSISFMTCRSGSSSARSE